jgi:HSP20 family protein
MTRFGWRDLTQAFNEMHRVRQEMDSLFTGTWDRAYNVYPAINIYDDGESYVARAELPGVEAASLDVSVTGNTLTIKGERQPEPVPQGASSHRRECDCGKFSRSFRLSEAVDSSKVMAVFKHGVLDVVMPRADIAKARKVQIVAEQ